MAGVVASPSMSQPRFASVVKIRNIRSLFSWNWSALLQSLMYMIIIRHNAMLKAMPEYADGLKKNAGPRILVGDPNVKAGRVFVDMTGGTEGPKKVFARLSQAGVGTIVSMHLSEAHFKAAKGEHINVIIAGHIASDTMGLNLLLDEVEKLERIRVIPCSGFVRVKR